MIERLEPDRRDRESDVLRKVVHKLNEVIDHLNRQEGPESDKVSLQIKPCPFCGESEFLKLKEYRGYYSVACMDCCCEGPIDKDRNEARREWNQRKGDK